MTETNQTLFIVIGLPGSGKTTYLQRLLSEGAISRYFDDYQEALSVVDGAEGNPRLNPDYARFQHALAAGENLAISDIQYCIEEEVSLVESVIHDDFPAVALKRLYFANDPVACRHNVKLRARPGYMELELDKIDKLTTEYNPPEDQTISVIMG